MIRINLLPPEMRRAERAPASRRISILLGIVATIAASACLAWVYMEIHRLDVEIATLQVAKAQAEEAVKDYETLKAEVAKLKARKDAIDGLKANRKFRWSKQLDSLADVIDALPKLWFSAVKFGQGSPSGETIPPIPGRAIEYFMVMRDSRTATADKTLYREVERVITEKLIDTAQFQMLMPPSTFSMEKQDKFLEAFSHKFSIVVLGLSVQKAPVKTGPGQGS